MRRWAHDSSKQDTLRKPRRGSPFRLGRIRATPRRIRAARRKPRPAGGTASTRVFAGELDPGRSARVVPHDRVEVLRVFGRGPGPRREIAGARRPSEISGRAGRRARLVARGSPSADRCAKALEEFVVDDDSDRVVLELAWLERRGEVGMPNRVLQRTYSTRFNDFALEFYSFVADNYAPFLGSSQGLFVELLQGPHWPSGTPRRLICGR